MTAIFGFHELGSLQWGVLLGVSLGGAIFDLKSRRIPNWLTAPTLLLGVALSAWRGGGALDALLGCLTLMAPYLMLFVCARGGAGDAKLMGALGAWTGLRGGFPVLLAVMAAGAFLGLGLALWRRQGRRLRTNLAQATWALALVAFSGARPSQTASVFPDHERMIPMPYGVAIWAGVCLAGAVARCAN